MIKCLGSTGKDLKIMLFFFTLLNIRHIAQRLVGKNATKNLKKGLSLDTCLVVSIVSLSVFSFVGLFVIKDKSVTEAAAYKYIHIENYIFQQIT